MANFQIINNLLDFNIENLNINYPFILKPYNGAGTSATFLVNSELEFKEKINYYKNTNQLNILIEEYINGEEYQVDGFIQNENLIFLISKYGKPIINIKNNFILNSTTLNFKKYQNEYNTLEPLIKKILKILNLNNSVFHMEFFNNKNEWYFSECGARIGGGLSNDLFESAWGISLSEILAKLVQYKNIDFKFVPSDLTYSYTYIQPFKKQIKTLPSESELKNQIKIS